VDEPQRKRGLVGPALVVVALTLAVVGFGVYWTGIRDRAPGARSPGTAATGHQPTTGGPQPTTSHQSTTPTSTGVHFSFDDGLAALAAGTPALAVRSAEGGQVTGVPHGTGSAVAFPEPCAVYGAPTCPRVVLTVVDDDRLSPGRRALRWGASVQITPSQTTKGSNVLQKGFSTGGGQFKLQVDGHAGNPSCVMVDSAKGSPVQVAKASISVADGAWHAVTCSRSGSSLTIAVDGTVVGQTTVPAELSVNTDAKLCIGGKGTSPNNDQFSGVLDDVFVDIEP